jgi:hypothetical protein
VSILVQTPFEKWGIDFVGPIAQASRNGQKWYIWGAIEYVTKRTKAQASRVNTTKMVA